MPLRDHFDECTPQLFRWESFHSQWAGTIVRQLNRRLLPAHYHAAPRVRLGTLAEIDVGALEQTAESAATLPSQSSGATAVYSPPRPALTLDADLSHAKVDVWPEPLQVGAALPTLPLWLRDGLAVPLDLEGTYEETCVDLRA